METTIKHIVDQFFKDNQLDQIKQVEQKLTKQFGKNFIEEHVIQITKHKDSIIIKTKTIESQTEINLYKKKLTPKNIKLKIK